MINLGLVGGGSLVGGGGLVGELLGVDSGALVGDIGDQPVVSVGGVLHGLDSAIGKSDGVRSLDIAGTIGALLGVEVSLGVVIGNGVGEGVGGDLIGVHLGLVGWGWLVGNWSRGVSHGGGGVHRGSRGGGSQAGRDDEDL